MKAGEILGWRVNAVLGGYPMSIDERAEEEAAARARLTAAYDQFMAEGDPAKKSEVGEDLIRSIFGRAAIAGLH
jgi:hypothetical protein